MQLFSLRLDGSTWGDARPLAKLIDRTGCDATNQYSYPFFTDALKNKYLPLSFRFCKEKEKKTSKPAESSKIAKIEYPIKLIK
ncbi:hypothetical protein [Methylobacter sp. sgz302048]|uniref:hypothetical protein n=1 Tax=Methylobacter sp. sgz302048 TaxID=3455945 RepID=UPI003F9EDC15